MQNLIKKFFVVIIALMMMIPASFVPVYAQEEETEVIEEKVQEVVDTAQETIDEDKTEEASVDYVGDTSAPDKEETDTKGSVFFVNPYYEDIVDALDMIGKRRGCLIKGGEVDYDKVYSVVINDIKDGLIKNITFDRWFYE